MCAPSSGPRTKIGYGADWSEYNNHQTGDAPGALLFNLDPLWSDANIDFVGIDNYMPLSDWRDGTAHLDYDAVNGPTDIHDAAYLTGNIRGGEDYDWYYASDADRDAQTRTPITDGLGKPWVFRAKGHLELVEQRALRPARRHRKRTAPPHGYRNPNPSGSPNWAVRRWTKAPTSRTCSSIRSRAKARCRTIPMAGATISSSAAFWKRI